MVGREHGMNNQAGDLIPQKSPWGQLLASGQGSLIDSPAPIGRQSGKAFHGTVGGVITRSASVLPLTSEGGYFGDVPQSQQDFVEAVEPWDRP